MRNASARVGWVFAAALSVIAAGCCGLNTAPGTARPASDATAVNAYMDQQVGEMRGDLENAQVQREGQRIKVTFGSGVLFGTGSAELTPAARENISRLAGILKRYPNTNVSVEGHTDSDGAEDFNQALSERRANAVAQALRDEGVAGSRIRTVGFGETQPIATNDTPEGKAANRRVEIIVVANESFGGR
ncbi:MAG TPA: OmpA family protein [Candidatus Latescibacteria bacterium]|nr:OmpA family protein [Candidatus Latescibacterota bacterium]HOS64977.1 OmpA family protein [Candidatus Latescibacterota bacterium]HPK74151.1 OmpA family protein [Candidatus Latescibacterota bacterium]